MPAIAIDVRMLESSGIGTYLRALLPRLFVAAPDIDFHLLGGQEARRYDWTSRGRIHLVDLAAPIYSVREQIDLARRIPRVDLVWSPHYNIPLVRRAPLIVTIHDLAHLARPEFGSRPHRRVYARAMFRAVRAARARCFDSHFTRKEYERLVGRPGELDRVIYPGVDESWQTAARRESPRSRQYLLYVGNVKPHKNLRGLIDAFEQCLDLIPHDLVIVGRKDGFVLGDAAVVERGERLGGRVTFTGHVDEAELQQYYLHAAALVFPSHYEGFGLPPLEAMACGCPVIVSDAASLPEVCGDAALYCDPSRPESIRDQILRLVREPMLASNLAAAGRDRACSFTWDRCAAETLGALRDALAAGPARAARKAAG